MKKARRSLIVLSIVAMTIPLLPVAGQEPSGEEPALDEAPVITTDIPDDSEAVGDDGNQDAPATEADTETVRVFALTGDANTTSTIADAAQSIEGVVAVSSTIGGLSFTDLVEIEAVGTDSESVAADLSDALGVTVAPGNTQMELAYDSDDFELAADPRQKNQWALKNPEQHGGVGAPGAWSRSKGKGAVVAVADSGLARGHQDMENITWRNPDEVPNNNRDDDGNGFVDDVYGWDFVQNDNRPQETIGHGTAVASLIAAPQNGKGISGVAPAARIMPLRVCPDRSCSMQAVLDATIYAGVNGADVLNLSLGGEYPNGHPDVEVIRRVMQRVQEEHGITIVAAAGNAGTNSANAELMPAESPGVIGAVATRRGGAFADAFSNFGKGMEVAAPGQDVLVARAGSFPGSGAYTRTNGTSFSSPLTAGTVALMKAADGRRTTEQIRGYLLQTVHEHPSLKGRADSQGIVHAGYAVWASKFDDIRGVVFIEDIAWLARRDITRGCNPPQNTRFCPGQPVTRGAMAAFLTRALNLPKPNKDFFGDDNNSVFQNDINRLAAAGITLGCNPPQNTKFCPNAPVTRGAMAAFLTRALNLPRPNKDFFGDDNNSVFQNDINRLASSGITLGCNPPQNTRFCPGDRVTRGQMAAFLRRGLTD